MLRDVNVSPSSVVTYIINLALSVNITYTINQRVYYVIYYDASLH